MRIFAVLLSLFVAAIAALTLFVYFGIYNVAATKPHSWIVYWLTEQTMRRSVRARTADITVPPLNDPALVERGFRGFDKYCTQCHGAPGVAPEKFALGMLPPPANLAHTAREWSAAEMFWAVKHGIAMTGMPAWEFRLPDSDLWAIVAFMQQLPLLSPVQYQQLRKDLKRPDHEKDPAHPGDVKVGPGDAERGAIALQQYACGTCHSIPGILAARAHVGPPLDDIATRAFIAGVIPNTPQNMMRWLLNPKAVSPGTAMPDLYLSERDARDIAAYLDTLR